MEKQVIKEDRHLIKGIKLRAIQPLAEGIGIKAVEITKKLAKDVKLLFMMHIGEPREPIANDIMDNFTQNAVKLMEKGDIIGHIMTWEAEGLILADGTIYPEIWEAQLMGIILNFCHGFRSFSSTVARQALQQGLIPTVISSDLAVQSTLAGQSLMVTMSKIP